MLSKALAMSTFRRRDDWPLENNRLADSWTRTKLSWMDRPRINAVWFASTSSGMRGANLRARILVRSLAKL
jgi:hypothetical protein